MYTVLRRYRVRLGTVAQAAGQAEATLLPLLKQVPGFVAYYLLDTGNSIVAAMSLFETKGGAETATRLFSDWFRSDWPAFRLIPPELSVGELLTCEDVRSDAPAASRESAVGTLVHRMEPSPERRTGGDRRLDLDRRTAHERRELIVPMVVERRVAADRRSVLERRSGVERRIAQAVAWVAAPQQIRPMPT
jgi:hypothetical protein